LLYSRTCLHISIICCWLVLSSKVCSCQIVIVQKMSKICSILWFDIITLFSRIWVCRISHKLFEFVLSTYSSLLYSCGSNVSFWLFDILLFCMKWTVELTKSSISLDIYHLLVCSLLAQTWLMTQSSSVSLNWWCISCISCIAVVLLIIGFFIMCL